MEKSTESAPVEPKELTEITPAQHFDSVKRLMLIATSVLHGARREPEISLITSDKRRLSFDDDTLAQQGYFSTRFPKPGSRWSQHSIEEFLSGDAEGSFSKAHELILQQLGKHVDVTALEYHELVSLWIIGTYLHRQFSAFPYLHLNGNAESGKSQTLSIIASLAFNGRLVTEISSAALVRLTHDNQSTLCIDEVEKLQHAKDEASKTMRAIMNSGYKTGVMVTKMECGRKDKEWQLKEYDPYSPKALAGIRGLEPSLASRCIPIMLVKSENEEIVNAILDLQNPIWAQIRDHLYQGAMTDGWQKVKEIYVGLHDDQIKGRDWETWRPILAIAKHLDVVFPSLYERMLQFARQLSQEKKMIANENNFAAKILLAFYDYLQKVAKQQNSFVPLEELLGYLPSFDEEVFKDKQHRSIHPWMDTKWLGHELRKTGLVRGPAQQHRFNGKNTKGFMIDYTQLKKRMQIHSVRVDNDTQF